MKADKVMKRESILTQSRQQVTTKKMALVLMSQQRGELNHPPQIFHLSFDLAYVSTLIIGSQRLLWFLPVFPWGNILY